jgi:hypothetical protein
MPKLDPTPMDGTAQSASEPNTANNDADNRADDDNSVIVSVTEESSDVDEDSSSVMIPMRDESNEGDSSDSEIWDGNPRPGDKQGW